MSGTDLREMLLARLQACVKTLTPGVVFTFPNGLTHRTIESNLQGRVYSRLRGAQEADLSELPLVEILTGAGQPDLVTPQDDGFFRREMNVQLLAYVPSNDAADSLDSVLRPDMNALLADLQVAVEAFPYWTDGVTVLEPLTVTHGPLVITPRVQYTEPASEQAVGILVLDYSISYGFPRLNP